MHLASTLKDHNGKTCPYCYRPMSLGRVQFMPTRDHYPIPKCKGGKRTIICCRTCNHLKGSMAPDEWAAFMAENKGGWFVVRPANAGLPTTPAPVASQARTKPLPIAHTKYILAHGTRAYRRWEAEGFPDAGQ